MIIDTNNSFRYIARGTKRQGELNHHADLDGDAFKRTSDNKNHQAIAKTSAPDLKSIFEKISGAFKDIGIEIPQDYLEISKPDPLQALGTLLGRFALNIDKLKKINGAAFNKFHKTIKDAIKDKFEGYYKMSMATFDPSVRLGQLRALEPLFEFFDKAAKLKRPDLDINKMTGQVVVGESYTRTEAVISINMEGLDNRLYETLISLHQANDYVTYDDFCSTNAHNRFVFNAMSPKEVEKLDRDFRHAFRTFLFNTRETADPNDLNPEFMSPLVKQKGIKITAKNKFIVLADMQKLFKDHAHEIDSLPEIFKNSFYKALRTIIERSGLEFYDHLPTEQSRHHYGFTSALVCALSDYSFCDDPRPVYKTTKA